MAPDYRSEPSESVEGKGFARRAWEAYARKVNQLALPIFKPLAENYGASQAADLIGFWLVWQLHGGFAGLQELGMHETTIHRKINRFRTVYKQHPDEFQLPGVSIDPKKYFAASAKTGR
jgi:hypothetical protein